MAINKSLFYKELSKKESNDKVKDLLKRRIKLQAKYHMQPGNLLFTSYNAKDKTQTYDKTPLVLILRRGSKYTLGLNFHWLPVSKRMFLISHIMRVNKTNIKNNKPLEFNYRDLKPMLKSLGYAPCIRLYINSRLGRIGVVVPPDGLAEIARLKAESFTSGRYSAAQLYQMAKRRK
jgi:hypothetical protein